MQTNTVNNILKYAIITGLFILPFMPLIVANSLFFPFITGKAFFLRIIIEIVFALWLILMLRDRSYAPKWSWLLGLMTIFTVVILVADFAGAEPLRSIWSNFERMEGWILIVHLWAYFLVAVSVLRDRKWWNYFFNVTLFAAVLVGLIGVAQLLGKAEIHQGNTRLDSSLGNAAYLGIYMLIHSFIALYMAFHAWISKKHIGWLYLALSILFGFIMFETGTRGSILGFGAGLFVTFIIIAIGEKSSEKRNKIVRYISVGAIALMLVVTGVFYAVRKSDFVQKNEVLSRLASISINDITTQARGFVWPMAIKGTFESPKTAILGVGQENFIYIFNKEYNPKMWMHEQWFDRAHSVYLDWLVAGGIFGLGLYLAILIFSFIYVWKSKMTLGEKAIFTGLLVGFSIHNVFVFDNLSSYLMFFSILAFTHVMRADREMKWLQKSIKLEVANYVFAPIVIIAFVTCIYFVNVKSVQANKALIGATQTCANKQFDVGLYAKALSYGIYTAEQETREQIVLCAEQVVRSSTNKDTINNVATLVKSSAMEEIAIIPNDARVYFIAGQFFNVAGDWADARAYLEKAKELSPHKQAVLVGLAGTYLNLDMNDEALKLATEAYESAPEYPLAKAQYAATLIFVGQSKKAEEIFKDDKDTMHDPRVLNAYVYVGAYTKLIQLYKEIVAENPKDIQTRISISAAYLKMGDSYSAIQNLRNTQKDLPEFKDDIEPIIKQIQEGKLTI